MRHTRVFAVGFALFLGCSQGGSSSSDAAAGKNGSAGGHAGGTSGSAGKSGSAGQGGDGTAGTAGQSGGGAGSAGSAGSGGKGGSAGKGGSSGAAGSGGKGGSSGSSGSGGGSASGGSSGSGGKGGAGGSVSTGGSANTAGSGGKGGSAGGSGGAGTCPAESATYLSPVSPGAFKIGGPLWKPRMKALVTKWIPYVNSKLSDTALAEGGIANFVEAGKKLKGQSAAKHVGLWFSNAYVMQQVEAMSAALMLDAQGDAQITSAQTAIKSKLADWIPKILSAQESDGYLQTAITLGSTEYGSPARWTNRMFHEGYVAGYFIEAAIVHNLATGETTLLDAARKMADCWVNAIGPSKKLWWDGHQEMEQALTRLARFVNDKDGAGAGDKYAQLAKFLLDSRGKAGPTTDSNDPGQNSPEYDQHQAAPLTQTTAVGHAVRALYMYSAMADVAMTTGTPAYLSAVDKIWDNMVNRKMYVNACVGAGDAQSAAEGFGPDYHLPSVSYCESCGGCGVLMFQHKMMLAHKDGRYADLAEMSLYNTVLGSIDLAGNNFEYRNPIDQNYVRYAWHPCPCCVGNVPRTVLEMPIWTYAKSDSALYVNMFVDSTMDVGQVAGTKVQMVQTTDYPWSGKVTITVNPEASKSFALKIRVPDRSVSTLYSSSPEANGITSIAVNGSAVTPSISQGYATICRTWNAGDKVEVVLPLTVQRVKAISQVTAVAGRVALQYGPLLYNIENVDTNGADLDTLILDSSAALTATWNGSLLEGVSTIGGKFKNGTSMTAIPFYSRLNRGPSTNPRSMIWIKDQ